MRNPRAVTPVVVCVCILLFGIGGLAIGIGSQLPASPAQPPGVEAPTPVQASQQTTTPPASSRLVERRASR